MSATAFIGSLTLIFVVAAALLVAATHFSLPPIPFYIIAGVLVGFALDQSQLLDLAQWGIVFLVFAFAVQLEPLSGGGLRRDSIIVAVAQAVVTGALMFGLGLVLGFDGLNAFFFALAATLGSSLVALSLLERRVRLRGLHERIAESIHFVEDVAAVLIILLLSAFVYAEGSAVALLMGVALIALGLFIRRYVFDRFTTAAGGDVEILMLTGISLIIGFIALTELTQVSIVVGAFAAGLAVPSEYPHDVETLDAIGYVEDFFAPIFFVTIGALVSVPTLEVLGLSAVLVVAVVVVNPLITYAVLRWRDYDSFTATLTGYNLDQVSEFVLIIAIEALAAERIVPGLFDAIILAAIVTMLISALTYRYVDDLYYRVADTGLIESDVERVRERSRITGDLEDHVIVTGYDRECQQIIEVCEELGFPYVVVESDPTRYETVREHCENYVLGDPMTRAVWQVAEADDAALIVATTAREEWAEQVLSFEIGVDTVVRAIDVETGVRLLERGALFVAIPDVLASERLCDVVQGVLSGDVSQEELRELGKEQVDQAVEYGPSDVQRIR